MISVQKKCPSQFGRNHRVDSKYSFARACICASSCAPMGELPVPRYVKKVFHTRISKRSAATHTHSIILYTHLLPNLLF